MKKFTYLRDGEKLSEAVIRKPSNGPPLHNWAKDPHERGQRGGSRREILNHRHHVVQGTQAQAPS